MTKSLIATAALVQGTGAASAEVTRHPIPYSDFPILQAVEIPADATLVYLSGTVPQVIDEKPNRSTRSVFEVAGLANPAWLVEIEVIAVRP